MIEARRLAKMYNQNTFNYDISFNYDYTRSLKIACFIGKIEGSFLKFTNKTKYKVPIKNRVPYLYNITSKIFT